MPEADGQERAGDGSAREAEVGHPSAQRLAELEGGFRIEPGVFGEGGENGLGTAEAGLEQPAGGVWFGHD